MSRDILLNHIPLTAATGILIQFIRLLNQCDTEERINDFIKSGNGPAFQQITGSSNWHPNEHITMKNKDILQNILLYEETIGHKGRGRLGGGAGFAKCFRYPAIKVIVLGILEKLTTSKMLSLVEWKTSDNEVVTNSFQWIRFI